MIENGSDFLIACDFVAGCKRVPPMNLSVCKDLLMYALSAEQPSLLFRMMEEKKILDVVCSPLHDCIGIEQDPNHHTESVYDHSLRTIDESAKITKDPMIRLAALLHDCGKADTRKVVEG